MATKKFYTVTVESYNVKGEPEQFYYDSAIRDFVGGKAVCGVFRELHSSLETYRYIKDDIENGNQYGATKTVVSLFASDDFKVADIKRVEERLGHDLDYFTEVGGELAYDGFVCELLPSDFERLSLFGTVKEQEEFEIPIFEDEDSE